MGGATAETARPPWHQESKLHDAPGTLPDVYVPAAHAARVPDVPRCTLPVPQPKGHHMSATVLEQLLELQQRPRGAEVLIDAGAVMLGEGEQWTRVRKVRPKAKFQVVVNIAGREAQYRADEVRGVREFGRV